MGDLKHIGTYRSFSKLKDRSPYAHLTDFKLKDLLQTFDPCIGYGLIRQTKSNYYKSLKLGVEANALKIDQKTLDKAVEFTKQMFSGCTFKRQHVQELLSKVNDKGSPGLPSILEGYFTKGQIIADDMRITQILDAIDKMYEGKPPEFPAVTKTQIKEEILKESKIDDDIGRIFQISPIDQVLLTNHFYGNFGDKLKETLENNSTWSSYGFVVSRGGMHELIERINKYRIKIGLDVIKWDKNVPGLLYWLALCVVDSLSEKPNPVLRAMVYNNIMHGLVATPDGDVYYKDQPFHQVSGSSLTTEMNIVMHTIILFYHWIRLYPELSYFEIITNVEHHLYGDNNIGGSNLPSTLEDFVESYSHFGMSLKMDETIISEDIAGIKFLGCEVKPDLDFTYDFHKICCSMTLLDEKTSTNTNIYIQRFVSLWVMGCQCLSDESQQIRWQHLYTLFRRGINQETLERVVGKHLARVPYPKEIRQLIKGVHPETITSSFLLVADNCFGPCSIIPCTEGINMSDLKPQTRSYMNAKETNTKKTKVLKRANRSVGKDEQRETSSQAQDVQAQENIQFEEERYLPSEGVYREEGHGSSQKGCTQTTSLELLKALKRPKEKEKQESPENCSSFSGRTSLESSTNGTSENKSNDNRVCSTDEYRHIIKLLEDGGLDPSQAYQRLTSCYHRAKTTTQHEQELKQINQKAREQLVQGHSGLVQKDSFRGGKVPSTGDTSRFPPVKSILNSMPKGSVMKQMDGGVGIVQSYVGHQNQLSADCGSAEVANKNSMRLVGHEWLQSINTGTVAPQQGDYIWGLVLNPRAWTNTEAQIASQLWQTYRFNAIKFKIVPQCATTTAGNFMYYINADIENNETLYGGALNTRVANSYAHTTSAQVWNACEISMSNFQDQYLYCDMNGDARFTYAGEFLAMVMASPPVSTGLINIYVEYDISFFQKMLNPVNTTLVSSGVAEYTATLNTSPTPLQFSTATLTAGTAPPPGTRALITVYEATNIPNLTFSDTDSGTKTFSIAKGSKLYSYSPATVTTGQINFYRGPPNYPTTNSINTVAISGGTQNVTFKFNWYAFQDT